MDPKVKPLPKAVTLISLITALAAAGASVVGMLPPQYAVIVAVAATALASFSHSLSGTGGTPENP